MGKINDDRELIKEGRKNVAIDLEDGEQSTAPLRDQISKKLFKRLKEDGVGLQVKTLWTQGNAQRREWLNRQREFLDDWDEFLVSSDAGPFVGSSTLHLPIPVIVAKTLHARFLQALLGIDPPFSVKARNDASVDRVPIVQEIMRYAINDWSNRREGATECLDDWIWDWVTTGVGILKLRWDVEFQTFEDVDMIPVPGPTQVQIDDQGNEILIPTVQTREQEVTRTIKHFEGPVFETVLVEDCLIVEGKGNPQAADAVVHRSWMTASELLTQVDRKVFDEDAVQKVIDRGPSSKYSGENIELKQQRSFNAGQEQTDQFIGLDRYEILEAYMKKDVDGSGRNSEVVVWVDAHSGELLRSTYLHRINKAGERPFFKIDFHKRRDQEYGIGIVEMIHPLTVELDAMHNLRIDYGMISTMPIGFYRPTSGIDPEVLALEPGSLIPVDNPQTDIVFPNMGSRTTFGFQEEASLQQMIDRLTNISDLNLGVQSSTQGATRTATGTRALLGESSSNLDVHLRRMNRGWGKALNYLRHMLQQRMPPNLPIRIIGSDGAEIRFNVEDRIQIQGDFDIEVDSNSSSSNQQIRIQNADTIAQVQQNPILIQLGVVGPTQLYEAAKHQLETRGIKDVSRYLQRPQQQRIFSPQDEADRILRGIPTPVTMEGDHEGFLRYFEFIQANDGILELFNPEAFQALAAQAQQHAQMLQALEELAAQQRNVGQQQLNAAQSQNQAPTGLNPFAGGAPSEGLPA